MARRGRRVGRLLVSVRAMSGRSYPAGTVVELVGSGSAVDAWAGGEWVPLRWWEFAECGVEEPATRETEADR
jgi:hypothetical protein